jgi:hypothetical protein
MGIRLSTGQKFFGGILNLETEGSWLKMTREVAIQNQQTEVNIALLI